VIYSNDINETFQTVLRIIDKMYDIKVENVDKSPGAYTILVKENDTEMEISLKDRGSTTEVLVTGHEFIAWELYAKLNKRITMAYPSAAEPDNFYSIRSASVDRVKGRQKEGQKSYLYMMDDGLLFKVLNGLNGNIREENFIKYEDIESINYKDGLFSGKVYVVYNHGKKIKIRDVKKYGNSFVSHVESVREDFIIKKKKADEERKLNKLIKKLEKKDLYIYIEKFVSRFKTDISDYNWKYDAVDSEITIKGDYQGKNINNLWNLLAAKGVRFSLDQLNKIILYEFRRREYNDFKRKITFNKPSTIEEFIENLYKTGYVYILDENLDYFKTLLQEKNLNYSETNILEIAHQIKKEKESEKLEKELEKFENELFEENTNKKQFISINEADKLDGYQFEDLLAILFEKMGYKVTTTPLTGDQGADLILDRFDMRTVVQAKRYENKVSNKAIQEVVAAIAQYNANNGMVVTNNEFTSSAIELADSNNIKLINRNRLSGLLSKYQIHKEEIL